MGWEGRQLKSAGKNGTNLSFTYDSEGIRTSKTVDGVTTSYLLNGTQILAQKTGSTTLSFFYDQQGNRVGMADSSNHIYYYLYNLQGDVIALADGQTGKLVATYTYDAWGKIVKINNQAPEAVAETDIAKINPFRYRGYYYDSESELYYLQSRYYDAETGRFINADAFATTDITTPLSSNMFAYCENNPIMRHDPTGEIYHIIAGAAIGAIINIGAQIIENGIAGVPLTDNLGVAMLSGAASGALAASGVGAVGQGVVGAAINVASYVASTPKEEFNVLECAGEAAVGLASGIRGKAGLTATKNVASQVKIINGNMHAVKTNWRAARTVKTCLSRISDEIHGRINSAVKGGAASGVVHGVYGKLKAFLGWE